MATPGEHQTIRGIEVVAASCPNVRGPCQRCQFGPVKSSIKVCNNDIECDLVIWLTPLDYIAHRLAGETT